MSTTCSPLRGVIDDLLALDVRKGLKEFLLDRIFSSAAAAAVANGGTSALLSEVEEVKMQAGVALGKKTKANMREIHQGLTHRGRGDLSKEVAQRNAGRIAVAHPGSDLPKRVADALSGEAPLSGPDSPDTSIGVGTAVEMATEEIVTHDGATDTEMTSGSAAHSSLPLPAREPFFPEPGKVERTIEGGLVEEKFDMQEAVVAEPKPTPVSTTVRPRQVETPSQRKVRLRKLRLEADAEIDAKVITYDQYVAKITLIKKQGYDHRG